MKRVKLVFPSPQRETSIGFLKYLKFSPLLLLFLLSSQILSAQTKEEDLVVDSTFLFMPDTSVFFDSQFQIDPLKAALYSAILPGLGQAYNGQYWKIPLIYGGGIAFFHLIRQNHRFYNQFRSAKLALSGTGSALATNPFEPHAPGVYSSSAIDRNTERYRRDRDYMMILAGVFYLLNIAEAHIAAHLKEFDINDELSVKMRPVIQNHQVFSQSGGLALTLTF